MGELQETGIHQITTEIVLLKQQTAQNIIEIGKRLIQAKEVLPHGEWGKWLKERVEFTERTAQRFMRVAIEVSKTTSLSDLPISKVYVLLDLPPEEREEFISLPHEVNGQEKTIDIMSTKEVQQLIKEKNQIEAEKKHLEAELQSQISEKDHEIERLANEEAYIRQRLKEKDEAIRRAILNKPETEVKAPEDYNIIKAENQRLAEQNKTLFDQKQQLARQVQETKSLHTDLVNITEFRANVGSFLDHMAKYTYYAESFSLIEKRQQTEFEKQVEKIESWCAEVRQAIRGERSEKTILIEGGYRVE